MAPSSDSKKPIPPRRTRSLRNKNAGSATQDSVPSEAKPLPPAAEVQSTPPRLTRTSIFSNRLLKDQAEISIEYVKGVGAVRIKNDLSYAMISPKPEKRVVEDKTFLIKLYSTKSRMISMEEIKWVQSDDGFQIAAGNTAIHTIPALGISRVSYNLDLRMFLLHTNLDASPECRHEDVLLEVDGAVQNSYQLRSMLESRFGAMKMDVVWDRDFFAKQAELFDDARVWSLSPRATNEDEILANVLYQMDSPDRTPFDTECTPEKAQPKQRATTPLSVSEQDSQINHDLMSSPETSKMRSAFNEDLHISMTPRRQKAGPSFQSEQTNTQQMAEELNLLKRFQNSPSKSTPKPANLALKPSKPAPKPIDAASKRSNSAAKSSKPAPKPIVPAPKPSDPVAKPITPAPKPVNPAPKPPNPAARPVNSHIKSAAKIPDRLVSDKSSFQPPSSNATLNLFYRSGESIKANDLVIRIRDPATMPDGKNKFDKEDVFDGPFCVAELPTPESEISDRLSQEQQHSFKSATSDKSEGKALVMNMQEKLIRLAFHPNSKAEPWTKLRRLIPVYDIFQNAPADADARTLYYFEVTRDDNGRSPINLHTSNSDTRGVCKLGKGVYTQVTYIDPDPPGGGNSFEVEKLRGKRIARCWKKDFPHETMSDLILVQFMQTNDIGLDTKREVLVIQYLVHWAGWPSEDDTWELGADNIQQLFIDEFDTQKNEIQYSDIRWIVSSGAGKRKRLS